MKLSDSLNQRKVLPCYLRVGLLPTDGGSKRSIDGTEMAGWSVLRWFSRADQKWHQLAPWQAQCDRMARLAPRHHKAAIHEDVRAEHAHHCHVRKRHLLSRFGAHRDILTDSDWASDKDRKSVSCVVTMIGEHCIRCHIATPSEPALSSGEVDHVDNVKGTSIGTGMQSMARDFGDERVVRVATDSSASKGSASRL